MISQPDHKDAACQAVRTLWGKGISTAVPEDPRTPEYADAALKELQQLQEDTPGIIKDVLDGADVGAAQLNVDPMHGLAELLQNADDAEATEVKLAIRTRGTKRDLVVVHNGKPVCLRHVLAMAMAFVSTKRDDPYSTGKFGIGLKTLTRIANGIEVSCTPYHFRIVGNSIEGMGRPHSIRHFYDPKSELTLIVLPLKETTYSSNAREWVRSWAPAKMLFLHSLRSLSWVNIATGQILIKHSLLANKLDAISWRRQRKSVSTQIFILKDRKNKLSWTRYDATIPIPKGLNRESKAIGAEATVSVAVPASFTQSLLYARLPTGITIDVPFSIDAPFDLNTARTEVQKNNWNDWLWKTLSEFVAELAVYLLEQNPTIAWYLIPLSSERNIEEGQLVTDWLQQMHEVVKITLQRRARIGFLNSRISLGRISYEDPALQELLRPEDYKILAEGRSMLPREVRDSQGRWRKVLDDLGIVSRISVVNALKLISFESAAEERTPRWFIQLGAAALEDGLNAELQKLPCIITANPKRALVPDATTTGLKLVEDSSIGDLAFQLCLVAQLDSAYLLPETSCGKIRDWLKATGQLIEKVDDLTVLHAIAERGDHKPLIFSDLELITLRNIVDHIEVDVEKDLIRQVGNVVSLDAFKWVGATRVPIKATVASSYLPAAIDRDPGGWPSVAGRTSEITWIASRYAKVLDPKDRNSGVSGARHFLNMLGAMISPRLELKNAYSIPWVENLGTSIPTLQREALGKFTKRAELLKRDYISPDLEKVITDICSAKHNSRRQKGLDLFKLLNRLWLRTYQQTATCTAGYYYHIFRELGDVPSTWIARLADQPWLETETGMPKPPRLIDIRSTLTQSIFGDAKDRFAWGLTRDANASLVSALGIQAQPKASAIISHLVDLRNSVTKPDEFQLREIYQYISGLCPKSWTQPDEKVDDLTIAQLRGKFGIGAHKTGLLWASGSWQAPSRVRLGKTIFGKRRSFVSESPATERLWKVLGIKKPDIADCIDILNEIAADSSPLEERSVLAETYRHLNELLGEASKAERHALASIPVSIGERWTNERPVYFLDDSAAMDSLASKLSIWHPPCSPDEMTLFIKVSNLTKIPAASCAVMGVGPADLMAGSQLREEFQNAVKALQNYLAQNKPQLYHELACQWFELSNAQLTISKNLGLEVSLPDGSFVNCECNAHLLLNPLTIYLRNKEDLFRYESGGRVISECFKSVQDRQLVSLAWCNPSVMAAFKTENPMALAENNVEDDSLAPIKATASAKIGTSIAPARQDPQQKTGKTPSPSPVIPRNLKRFDSINVINVQIVNPLAKGGKQRPNSYPGLKDPGDRGNSIGEGGGTGSAPRAYTDKEREQLALQLLSAIVSQNKVKLKDFTRLQLVGADAGDDLKRFFEIKAHGGEMPDTVKIEMSEVLRAQRSGKDFYLAVVSGLEEGYQTVIKLFAKPLETLDWVQGTSFKLAGVKSKKALEIHLDS